MPQKKTDIIKKSVISPGFQEITCEALQSWFDQKKNFRIIDIREPMELQQGFIKQSENIPKSRFSAQTEPTPFKKDIPVVLYCAKGRRSTDLAGQLSQKGYNKIFTLSGGIEEWQARSLPMEYPDRALSQTEYRRYSRHLLLPQVGIEGQKKLKRAKVLIVGLGGLGAPSCLYLAAAGVGTIGLVDFDKVELSNLQRQILYREADVQKAKAGAAQSHLNALNSEIRLIPHEEKFNGDNAKKLISNYDIVLGGSDNFEARYLLNDTCYHLNKTFVDGAVSRFEGQVTVFSRQHKTPCYRCLYPERPPKEIVPNCQQAGVLGAVPGTIGLFQTTEVLKLILGIGQPLLGRLLIYNALAQELKTIRIKKNPNCPVCGIG